MNKFMIESNEYLKFEKMYFTDVFPALRFGQAFFNHFKLHRSNEITKDHEINDILYNEPEITKCQEIIHRRFDFN